MRTFGRKGLTPAPPVIPQPVPAPVEVQPEPSALPPETFEEGDPATLAEQAGRTLFETVERIASADRGRIEDVLAILAANGGFACILAAFDEAHEAGASPQGMGMVLVEPKDKHRYWFGDVPNRYLVDGEDTVVGHVLSAVRGRGGVVTTDMVEGILRRVAGSVGGPIFGVPNVSALHLPGDTPMNYVKFVWPKLAAVLDALRVPTRQRPAAFGFALRAAIEACAEQASPPIEISTVAQIAIECAVPMAKLDPARFGF
jgi:hypothetical protein